MQDKKQKADGNARSQDNALKAAVPRGALMRVGEAAAYLNVSPGTLYHWVSSRTKGIPCVHLGKRCLRFKPEELNQWVAEHAP